uniref:class I SAM-dependent methyltransferase n=1 Tax=Thermogemmatispora sp. TaxID=1968838 RepID=UPI0035E46336
RLDWPDASFDLINGRLLCGFMLPAAWPRLLAECHRLLKPGGIIRLTETEGPWTNSPATEQYWGLIYEAFKRAGQSFSPDGRRMGIVPILPRLVRQTGFEDVRVRASIIEWSMGTEGHYAVFKDYLLGFELVQPFLIKVGVATKAELERLYQQAVAEMQQDDFCGLWPLVTIWGRKPAAASQGQEEETAEPAQPEA